MGTFVGIALTHMGTTILWEHCCYGKMTICSHFLGLVWYDPYNVNTNPHRRHPLPQPLPENVRAHMLCGLLLSAYVLHIVAVFASGHGTSFANHALNLRADTARNTAPSRNAAASALPWGAVKKIFIFGQYFISFRIYCSHFFTIFALR